MNAYDVPPAIASGLGLIGFTLLVAVVLVGSLYHRAMSLPADRHEHGRKILGDLTELVRVLRGRRRGGSSHRARESSSAPHTTASLDPSARDA